LALRSLSKRQREALSKLLFVFKVTTYGEKEREIAIQLHDAVMAYTQSKANKLEGDKGTIEKAKEALPSIKHPMWGMSLEDLRSRNG
jgi:arginyl-tRNA synthetase